MPITRIDHFTLRTAKVDETAAFYCDVLGMRDGWRPPFPFPGKWLYVDDQPVVHIANVGATNAELDAYLGAGRPARGQGALDHIALRCTNLPHFRHRLAALGQRFVECIVPELAEHQLFVEDPNGVKIELIFPYAPEET